MFQHKLITPLVLLFCLSFIFACQKEPAATTTETPVSATDATADDRENACCFVQFNSFAVSGNDRYAMFFIQVFTINKYYYTVERMSDGATYSTPLITPISPYSKCMNTKVTFNLTECVATQFNNCLDKYRVTCQIVSANNSCSAASTSTWLTQGNSKCF